jgi:hypothetical protein
MRKQGNWGLYKWGDGQYQAKQIQHLPQMAGFHRRRNFRTVPKGRRAKHITQYTSYLFIFQENFIRIL